MIIKNFQAETIKDALELVKVEFGSEAVILKTDIVREKGARSFTVTAAKDYTVLPKTTPVSAREQSALASRSADRVVDGAPSQASLESALLDVVLPDLLNPQLRSLFLALRESDVEAALARRICRTVGDNDGLSFTSLSKAVSSLIRSDDPLPTDRDAVVFVGPPGGGKSSLLAKYAADMVFNRGVKVSLSTLDRFRPTAEDEIKSLADVLGFVDEATENNKKTKNQQNLLLVDTEGLVPGDDPGFEQLGDNLREITSKYTVLVLSAAVNWRSNRRFIGQFAHIGIDFIAVTQLDMASGIGTPLNIAAGEFPPLVCVTDSRMPTGLTGRFDPNPSLRKMLGGDDV